MDYKAALVDLLAEVEMPPITRHWVDEYLSHWDDDSEGLRQELEDLEYCMQRVSEYAY